MSTERSELPNIPEEKPQHQRRLSLYLEDQEGMRSLIRNVATIKADVSIPNPNAALFEKAYEQLKAIESTKSVSVANILVLVAICMRITQNLKRDTTIPLTNDEKKAIVINMITRWVDDNDALSSDDKLYLNGIFIPTMLDGAIDSLCSLDVHNVATEVKQCCSIQ